MGLGDELEGGESWFIPEALARRLWKLAKLAEWSGWNSKWNQRCCPFCGGPESYRVHDEFCEVMKAVNLLERIYPQVTTPLPLDPIEELEAKALERMLFGEIEDHVREENHDPEKPRNFWE
jgi:hypothetical protein